MIHLPHINPDMFVIAGMIHVRWYGFMYLLGFVTAWFIGRDRWHRLGLHHDALLDYFSYVAFGILIGGRLGYMMIYQLPLFLQSPWTLFTVWKGGMAFHGALLGGLVALILFSRSRQLAVFKMIDFTMPLIPPGLFFGRFGNFINGELWGRITDVPWAVIFPQSNTLLPRHPSQLYQSLCEGFLIFFIILIIRKKAWGKVPGNISGLYLILYSIARFSIEIFREPDSTIYFEWLTKGQLYSIFMLLIGIIILLQRKYFLSKL